jgi:hypothetical protein
MEGRGGGEAQGIADPPKHYSMHVCSVYYNYINFVKNTLSYYSASVVVVNAAIVAKIIGSLIVKQLHSLWTMLSTQTECLK